MDDKSRSFNNNSGESSNLSNISPLQIKFQNLSINSPTTPIKPKTIENLQNTKTIQNNKMTTTTSDITQTNPETSGTIKTNFAHSQRSNEKLPRYREGNNLQAFFKLYKLTANFNGWETCQEKLADVHNSFQGKLLEWVINQSWETWEDIKTSLMERQEVATKDDMYYITKLLHTKRKNFATLNKFIIKFDSLIQARRNIQSQNQQVVTDFLDPFYMKLFIKNNTSPAEMRRYLKEKPSTKLSEMYKLARSFEDEES